MSLFLLLMTVNVAYGLELACQGEQRNSQVKTYFVDCSNFDAVVDALKGASELLERESRSLNMSYSDLIYCSASYNEAEGSQRFLAGLVSDSMQARDTKIRLREDATRLLSLCNHSLQYIK